MEEYKKEEKKSQMWEKVDFWFKISPIRAFSTKLVLL